MKNVGSDHRCVMAKLEIPEERRRKHVATKRHQLKSKETHKKGQPTDQICEYGFESR